MNRLDVRRPRHSLLALLLLLPLAGCDIVGLDGAEGTLEDARERWEANRPASYVYAVARRCFCAATGRGPVRVTVTGQTVVSRVYVDDGSEVPAEAAEWFPTVDGLFDVLDDAHERGAHTIDVTYDEDLGVPVEFWIDYEEFPAAEELGFEVTESVVATG